MTNAVKSAPRAALKSSEIESLCGPLKRANLAFAGTHPGDSPQRQPVHVVYGGAHLFKRESSSKLGELALRALGEYGRTPEEFSEVFGLPGGKFAETLYARVREKLEREPVEDFRIDFEDGYGNRPDSEEDGHAAQAASEVARGLKDGGLPPFLGIRIKPLSEVLRARSLRTLDIFVSTLASSSGGLLPPNFVVTLPKLTSPAQPAALSRVMGALEKRLKLKAGTLKMELMVETPQSIFSPQGGLALPELVRAAAGRCVAAHFGTYDYTALLNITAAHQTMTHPGCDFAKHVMQVSLSQTGIQISDGATNIMPVPVHRAASGGDLTEAQRKENRAAIHRAWKLHFDHVRHSLVGGFYEGWDLHPAQLPSRYAAVYSFFLEGLQAASGRLENFVNRAAQATLSGDVFDDAATGQGLLNFFLRGLNCGAITMEEAAATGLSPEEFLSRSFVKILEGRRKKS